MFTKRATVGVVAAGSILFLTAAIWVLPMTPLGGPKVPTVQLMVSTTDLRSSLADQGWELWGAPSRPAGSGTQALASSWSHDADSMILSEFVERHDSPLSASLAYRWDDPEDSLRRIPLNVRVVPNVSARTGADDLKILCGDAGEITSSDYDGCTLWVAWARYERYTVKIYWHGGTGQNLAWFVGVLHVFDQHIQAALSTHKKG